MTEASGLANGQAGAERTPNRRYGAGPETSENPHLQHSGSMDSATRWAEQLREVTVKAPLRPIAVAFLLGAWFARRR